MTGKIRDRQDVSGLSREELEARLKAAEDVCVMYGWSPSPSHRRSTNRELATLELWMRWVHLVGADASGPKANVELDKSETALAAARRKTVERTMRAIDKVVATS